MQQQLRDETIDVSLPTKTVDLNATVEERLTDNAVENILPARYLRKDENGVVDETASELFDRVATNVAKPEKFDEDFWREEFAHQMRTLKFMPNSPTLMNAGTDMNQLSACFVLEMKDNMDDILQTAKNAGHIFKSGGGVGYSFSELRPKGTLITSTQGYSSGPVSFMRIPNEVCNQVKQGGKRRGAQMGIMRVDHPDIGRFVTAKRTEGDLSNFNISVGVTDTFIEAVKNDELYTLNDPQTDFDSGYDGAESGATRRFYHPEEGRDGIWEFADEIYCDEGEQSLRDKWGDEDWDELLSGTQQLPARFVWDIIIDGAWKNGEPGLFYLDETNRKHSFDVDKHEKYKIRATNPCFTGDTRISTGNGLVRADELYENGTAVNVTVDSRLSDKRSQEASSVYVTGEKDVYTVSTSEGYEIRVTADHQFKTNDGWVEAQDLDSGDTVHIVDREGQFGSHGTEALGASMGWLVGDGHIHQGDEAAVLNFYDEDSTISEQFSGFVNEEIRPAHNDQHDIGVKQIRSNEQRIKSTRLYELAAEMGLVSEKLQVPDTIMGGSSDMASGFLRALFTADGHVENTNKSKAVVLSSKSKSMLKDVQLLLLNFGIYSTIYTDRKKAGKTEIKGETYDRDALHGLHITKESLEVYQESIGFYRDDKSTQLDELLDSYTRGPYSRKFEATVESVEYDGHETVYDLTEPVTNSLVGNGFVIHNCAEQPLNNFEACNLGHVNLSLFKKSCAPTFSEFDGDIEEYFINAIDLDDLRETIRTGVRFLDNVATMSDFPLDEIEQTVDELRKIGLGVMGWAQLLYQMDIRYGSDESIELGNILMNHIDRVATEASHELGLVKGTFDAYEDSKYADPIEYREWFESHTYQDADKWTDGYPMRNHNVTTVAPTGTTSMLGDTSSGIEPVYNVVYEKQVADDIGTQVEIDSYFRDVLAANDIDVQHVKYEAMTKIGNDNLEYNGPHDLPIPEEIADRFVTTSDVSARAHTLMQRTFQDGVDSGISKTINLPYEATRGDITDAFTTALSHDERGAAIKGLTAYRDQSRKDQVMTTQSHSDKEIEEATAILEDAGYDVTEADE